jgi:hypothetical protein
MDEYSNIPYKKTNGIANFLILLNKNLLGDSRFCHSPLTVYRDKHARAVMNLTDLSSAGCDFLSHSS